MRKILLALGGLCVVAASFIGALVAMERLWPRPSGPAPTLVAVPPLPPVTRTSVMIAPVAVTLPAIRAALEKATPRDLAGKSDNPLGRVLSNSDIGWTVTR